MLFFWKGACVMKKALGLFLAVCFGVALGRMFDGAPATAAGGDGQGAGVQKCAAKNGDVNSDGEVGLSDAVTILGFLFLGNPQELMPLCVPPDLTARIQELEAQLGASEE